MSDLAIKVENVSKAYTIWRDPTARLKHPFLDLAGELFPALRPRIDQKMQGLCTEFYALKDVSFEVRKGESVGIIGRNGCGKSTLLQIIAGTLQPTDGSVTVNGRVAALLELGSGFNPEFTGQENVYLNCSILGLSKEETDAKFDSIAEFADIGDFLEQPVKTYSSGMTMRLAFAVIAHVDADILIVDEALAVGDVFFVQKCMRFIRKFQKQGTLLYVTHDTSGVRTLCQKALWLEKGIAKGYGSSKNISERYLEATCAERQGVVFFEKDAQKPRNEVPRKDAPFIDQRAEFLNNSNLRNDLQIFEFNPDSSAFGAGGAVIEEVRLLDARTGSPLSFGVGGEEVILSITARARVLLERPILGFYLKNHLGLQLFGDNTYLSHLDSPCAVSAGETVTATFRFQMPYLPPGDYMFATACANGTQEDHVQHHYLHEALTFRSESSHVVFGLMGLPLLDSTLSHSRM
jgi:lipopolysaccharide transport system ATP-binding protein